MDKLNNDENKLIFIPVLEKIRLNEKLDWHKSESLRLQEHEKKLLVELEEKIAYRNLLEVMLAEKNKKESEAK